MSSTTNEVRRNPVRVAILDGDKTWRAALAARLMRADCQVVSCPGVPSLLRVLDAHRREMPGGHIDLLVLGAASEVPAWLDVMSSLGAFTSGAPVLVTPPHLDRELEQCAYDHGAELVLSKTTVHLDGVVLAVQRIVEGDRRWSGEWISTALLERDRRK